jgi:hypothetical protein
LLTSRRRRFNVARAYPRMECARTAGLASYVARLMGRTRKCESRRRGPVEFGFGQVFGRSRVVDTTIYGDGGYSDEKDQEENTADKASDFGLGPLVRMVRSIIKTNGKAFTLSVYSLSWWLFR